MASETMTVGVVIERRTIDNRWASEVWSPAVVLPDAPAVAPWTPLGGEPGRQRFYLGPAEIELHSVDTERYRDNLASGRPAVWVVLRPTGVPEPPYELLMATVDPAEGEAATEAGTDIVEPVAMPADVAARVAAFVETHHVEREFFKRKRDRADPEALAVRAGRGPRIRGEDL